jgi:hypothetical protein
MLPHKASIAILSATIAANTPVPISAILRVIPNTLTFMLRILSVLFNTAIFAATVVIPEAHSINGINVEEILVTPSPNSPMKLASC